MYMSKFVHNNQFRMFPCEKERTYPLVLMNLPPALTMYLECKFIKSLCAVSGLSDAEPLAFLSGENSSSRATSKTANFLKVKLIGENSVTHACLHK